MNLKAPRSLWVPLGSGVSGEAQWYALESMKCLLKSYEDHGGSEDCGPRATARMFALIWPQFLLICLFRTCFRNLQSASLVVLRPITSTSCRCRGVMISRQDRVGLHGSCSSLKTCAPRSKADVADALNSTHSSSKTSRACAITKDPQKDPSLPGRSPRRRLGRGPLAIACPRYGCVCSLSANPAM